MSHAPSILAVLLLSTPAVAPPAMAQVEIATNAEGRRVISNVGRGGTKETPETLTQPRVDLIDLIERHAARRGLDPLLVRALIQVESGYDSRAVSRKGAMGLMQLMPQTAAQLSVVDPFDPEANIRGGTDYLRLMLDRFDKKLSFALAGYNAGPEAVRRYGGVPPYQETRQYVRRVLSLYRGAEFSDILETPATDGRKTFLVRRGGRLIMTTTPPDRR